MHIYKFAREMEDYGNTVVLTEFYAAMQRQLIILFEHYFLNQNCSLKFTYANILHSF